MDNTQRAARLISSLADRGIQLRIEGSGLGYRGPAGVITAEDRTALSILKPSLLALLAPPVIVFSRLLGERVQLVEALATPAIPGKSEPVTYDRGELQRMQGLSPDAVRAIHQAKRRFGGVYTGPSESRAGGLQDRPATPSTAAPWLAERSAAR